jgi:hypothetical protein
MEGVQIWSAMYVNIGFAGLVGFQKKVFFIKCNLILERQEFYVYLLINILTDKEIQRVCALKIYL